MIAAGEVLLDRFEVGEELGQGGLAWVASAFDRVMARQVALKFLLPQFARRPVIRERFRREVELNRRLEHPYIVRVFDLFEDGDRLFFSMALCPGRNLKQWTQTHPSPDARQREAIVRQLVDALASAHDAGVVHRDLKPHNVMIDDPARVTLLDFGLARVETMATITSHSVLLGTPDYQAPEAMSGMAVDGRSDLYSLGVLWFELATGYLPTTARTPLQLLQVKTSQGGPAPEGPDVSSTEAAIVQRLLRRDPQERPASARELAEMLDRGPSTLPRSVARFCARCGTESDAAPPFCLGCGAAWGSPEATAGDNLLVLMRADGDPDELTTLLGAFGADASPTEPPPRPDRLPQVLLSGVDGDLARAIQQVLVRHSFTTEVRRMGEDNFDLLHRTGTPGLLFVGGLLGGWGAVCLLAWFLAGTPALCVALALGPPLGWLFQRRAHLFLASAFQVQYRQARPIEQQVAVLWRAWLDDQPPASLRTLGEGIMLRAHRLLQATEALPPGPAEDLAASALHIVRVGLDDLSAAVRLEAELAVEDTRALWEAIDAATSRARFATSPARADAEQARIRQLVEELRRLGEREEERTRAIERVLALCTSLERARRAAVAVIEHSEGRTEEQRRAQLHQARARLHRDSRLLTAAEREVERLDAGRP